MADENERYFGWRPSLHDARDLKFSVSREVQEALPPSINLIHPPLPAPFTPPWQQGSLGSCGPQSAAADIVFAMFRQMGLTSAPMPSRLFIYWCTRKIMGTVESDSGVDNRSLMKALAHYGYCDETLWPYNVQRFREQPPAACFEQAATRKIDKYLAVPQDLIQMKGCLAGGDPFIFGFSVYQSMLEQEVERTGDIQMPTGLFDSLRGGHDVVVCGYSDETRRFLIRNSWGNWGNGGYGTIPYEYAVNPQLAQDFWTIKSSMWPSPIPVPVPPTPAPFPPAPLPTPEPTPPPLPGRHTIVIACTDLNISINGKVVTP